jgi:hypothetical protein
MQGTLRRALARDKAVKDELVKGILANKRNSFAETQLRAMELEDLKKLAELSRTPVANYEGQAGGPEPEDEENAPPMAAVFNLDERKTA